MSHEYQKGKDADTETYGGGIEYSQGKVTIGSSVEHTTGKESLQSVDRRCIKLNGLFKTNNRIALSRLGFKLDNGQLSHYGGLLSIQYQKKGLQIKLLGNINIYPHGEKDDSYKAAIVANKKEGNIGIVIEKVGNRRREVRPYFKVGL